DGAVVLSLRGGDFELHGGQDFAIGYRAHDADGVELVVRESMTFCVYTPEAAVPLRYDTSSASAGCAPRRAPAPGARGAHGVHVRSAVACRDSARRRTACARRRRAGRPSSSDRARRSAPRTPTTA